MLDTFILKIDRNIEKDDYYRLLGYVSEEKKIRISEFYRFEDSQHSLLGDVLVRYAICNRLGIKNDRLVFGSNGYGKPILLDPHGIHFNISHSGSWVVCAIEDKKVGIDVELIKPINMKIAERFFSKDEYISLRNVPEKMRLKYFYMLWTLKESYIKAEGNGLNIPLSSFMVNIESYNLYNSEGSEIKKYCFYQYFLENDTVCVICTLARKPEESMRFDIDLFLEETHLI